MFYILVAVFLTFLLFYLVSLFLVTRILPEGQIWKRDPVFWGGLIFVATLPVAMIYFALG
jgi:uncharacterized BrkB/YihY/UPF0761 family membrane protein